jgi:flagellar protein FlgJ
MAPIVPISGGMKTDSETELKKQRLRETCEEFEAIMMQYLLKSMRQTVDRAEEPDQAREIYEAMLDEHLAREISRNQSNGLAATLYQQLLPALKAEVRSSETID